MVITRRHMSGSLAASIGFLSAAGPLEARDLARGPAPNRGEAEVILHRRVNVEKRSVGMAVALANHDGVQIICEGRERLGDDQAVSGETLFEIGSITKIFTALLLAGFVRDGKVSLNDPVARHLPADFVLPERDGRPITLADLATHTAGFPRFPPVSGFAFGAYSLTEFKQWLAGFQLPRAPGSGWEYSNLGYALIGIALSHRTGRSYEELLRGRILEPLGLDNTLLYPPAGIAHLAGGHDHALKPTPSADFGIFAAAGSLRSSAKDMGRFMRAVMPGSGSPIEPLNRSLLQTVRLAPQAGGRQALGWEILPATEGEFVSKDGVTGGQTASAVYDRTRRNAVVVLSNVFATFNQTTTSPSGGGIGAADVAQHLLRPSIPLGV